MKKYAHLLWTSLLLWSCTPSSLTSNNPYIPNYTVNAELNLNLPQYSNLKFVSNAVYIPNQGARGLIVFNASGGFYNAFDAACPNQPLSACTTLSIKGGISAVCSCDGAEYSLFSGQSPGKQYPLKQYRVEVSGNVLRIYN